jgi:hypothetical protein
MLPELLHRSPEALFFPEVHNQRFEYYSDAPEYCTTKAPEYCTTTYFMGKYSVTWRFKYSNC